MVGMCTSKQKGNKMNNSNNSMTVTTRLFLRKVEWQKNGETKAGLVVKFTSCGVNYTAFRDRGITTMAWNAVKPEFGDVMKSPRDGSKYRVTKAEFDITFRPLDDNGKVYIEAAVKAAPAETPEDMGL